MLLERPPCAGKSLFGQAYGHEIYDTAGISQIAWRSIRWTESGLLAEMFDNVGAKEPGANRLDDVEGISGTAVCVAEQEPVVRSPHGPIGIYASILDVDEIVADRLEMAIALPGVPTLDLFSNLKHRHRCTKFLVEVKATDHLRLGDVSCGLTLAKGDYGIVKELID